MSKKTMLDDILDKMLETVSQSKEQVFDITEQSRNDYSQLQVELARVQMKVATVIEESDRLERQARFARNRLSEVSKNFDKYTDEEVRNAYEMANDFQVKLALYRQEETQLREHRDTLERRLIGLQDTIKKAEKLVGQISVVLNYLTSDLQQVSELIKDAKEMQEFGLKIIEAQEEERKRVSREIHDGPAQMMANVLLRSELVERIYRENGIEDALKEIRDLRVMVKNSLSEVRRIIYDLRPMALDDLGVIPTLAKYLKNFQEHTGITVSFRNLGKEERLPAILEIAIFRFVQEAVQNAYKHAKPKEVQVKMEIKATKVVVVIKDDGAGFDQSEKKEGAFGLLGMKERVNMLKGELTIDSKVNKGTLIMLVIPIHK
ncbi:sensor histidine kinase [Anaerobacillus isosaccharinicus]|uniref:Signal transduction histidine-protein kinase/phosphatase DegS n=1 Tax=Anaerobacillus isosaccharinicus TaxID=1532552 RepID=A0A1S2M8X9_9BACI|nr:sensor histidine kinase [Anaerobacillus isosaccharinicus]MBA5584527.1 ATP-binding protein [Anaerobacillus isosaccharinicus]QOY37090.1 ATP-binding protein [Anaerobacillus isosaccharinicus]